MQNLQTLIGLLSSSRKIHISIFDFSGILNTPDTKIDYRNVIHSKKFCTVAKSTDRGYRLCMSCKKLANTKAIKEGRPFVGQCPYGICEAAVPVLINGNTAAVVYVGNAIVSTDSSAAKIKKVCRYTSTDRDMLISELSECEKLENLDELTKIGEIVSDYIKLLLEKSVGRKSNRHWLVNAMLIHAKEAYRTPLTLKNLAVLYNKSEKYMGRLWNKEMGMSFHEYCLLLQLEKAESMLRLTNEKILDISLECGFNSISYFNRVFKAKYALTPTEYRRSNR